MIKEGSKFLFQSREAKTSIGNVKEKYIYGQTKEIGILRI